jgi:hypothetical protein
MMERRSSLFMTRLHAARLHFVERYPLGDYGRRSMIGICMLDQTLNVE